MKFDIKQSFLGLVISLVIVILFSSYLGIYMKEGFEDDVPPEDLGDFVPEDVEYADFVGEEAPKVDPSQTEASMQSFEEYKKSMKEQEERNKAFAAEAEASYAAEADAEAAEEAAYEAEKKKAAETIAAMQAAIKAGSSSRDDIKKQLSEYIAKSQAELAALKSKSDANKTQMDANKAQMGNLDFIPSSERGSFAKQDMVTGFFNTTDQKIQSAKNLAAQANSSAEVAKSRAMAALNKANQAPPAPDLSGYATKQMFGQMDQKLGGFATKEDLNPFATKAEIGNLATKAQLGGYATQADLNAKVQSAGKGNFATQEQLNSLRNEFNSKFLKHGDEITLRSRKTGRRLQDRGWGRFANKNRMWWERFHIEKCGQPGMYDNRQCR